MLAVILSVFLVALTWAFVVFHGEPMGIAIVATAAVALAWAVALVWSRLKARKAASAIEKALEQQAQAQSSTARPDQQPEIEEMQQEFRRAVQALKSSKLARGGRDALGVLPWYMIIGPPGAGKSTALRASGLKFPYLSKRGGVRGVGGTRNCEWWLTNEAVLLDTAGRYSTEEDDHDEWMGFLDVLSRARPRKPINGLLVAVSVADVGSGSEEEAAELGRQMRTRVDEVMARLQAVLPVYVLFTKCDLLPGFVETFGSLPKADRAQVWGVTVPLEDASDKGELVRERLAELLGVVEERCLARIGDERQIAARERIYEFPQQLDAVLPALGAFVDALFTESVYHDTPILRGLYFTSGTQEGRVIDRVMASMAEAFGIPPVIADPEHVTEARSYFLHDLFTKVLIPDRGIAFRSAKALKRDRLRRWAGVGAAVVAAMLVVAFPLVSFLQNRELVASTGAMTDAIAAKLRAGHSGPPPVKELEPIRERLAFLVESGDKGPPWSMRLGLYRGAALEPGLRRFYAAAVRRLVVDPVFRRDVDDMAAFVRRMESTDAAPSRPDYARFYDALKLHLLLTAPRDPAEPPIGPAEQAWIGAQIADRWASRVAGSADPPSRQAIGQHAALFARLLALDASLALPRYEDLVRRDRLVLARVAQANISVDRLAAEADGKGYDVTLASLLQEPSVALRAGPGIRGAFTRKGYESVVEKRLKSPRDLIEVWVIAGDARDREERAAIEEDRLRSRYYERYIEEWRRFVESVSVVEGTGAATILQELTRGEPPVLARLFQGVAENTRLTGAGAALEKQVQAGLLEKVRGLAGSAGAAVEATVARANDRGERRVGPADVEAAFAGFVAFGHAAEPAAKGGGGPAPRPQVPLDRYQEQLTAVRNALQAAGEGAPAGPLLDAVSKAKLDVQALIDARPIGWRPTLKALLWPPISLALRDSGNAAVREVAQRWCNEVAVPFKRTLAGRYPFARDSRDDAAVADVAEFFRPASGKLWATYDQSLARYVQRSGDTFRFARGMEEGGFRPDLLGFLRRGHELTTVLFPAGAAEPTTALSVRIRPTPRVSSVVLEVDGQRIEQGTGPEEVQRLVWPGPSRGAGAVLRVRTAAAQEETLERGGEWGLYRLVEAGAYRLDPNGRDFAVTFEMQTLGLAVTIDFRPARSDTPFFGMRRGSGARLLEPFRATATVPLDIGREGGCTDAGDR